MKRVLFFVILSFPLLGKVEETVTFPRVLRMAVNHDFGLKILRNDKKIKRARAAESEAEYYPMISLNFNTQYSRSLDNETSGGVTVIGDTTIDSLTGYESSVSVRVGYTIYDFGARDARLQIARLDVAESDAVLGENLQKLKLEILDLYKNILKEKVRLRILTQIERIGRRLYRNDKRLYKAGEIGKRDLAVRAVKLADTEAEIAETESRLGEALGRLEYYTGRRYRAQTRFRPFRTHKAPTPGSYKQTPEYRKWILESKKKLEELRGLEAGQYPRIELYGSYNLYGSSRYTPGSSLEDIRPGSFTVGIGASLKLFEGFKNRAVRQRFRAELMEIKLKNRQAEAEYRRRRQAALHLAESYGREMARTHHALDARKRRLAVSKRLAQSKELASAQALEEQIAVLRGRLALSLKEIERAAKLKELEMLHGK